MMWQPRIVGAAAIVYQGVMSDGISRGRSNVICSFVLVREKNLEGPVFCETVSRFYEAAAPFLQHHAYAEQSAKTSPVTGRTGFVVTSDQEIQRHSTCRWQKGPMHEAARGGVPGLSTGEAPLFPFLAGEAGVLARLR
ncbi:UNVERIFIED_CONTAM: hypothetical protein FKN15_037979 [Acipenser sinensis]